MKAVMYHYVREPQNEFPHFTYLHRDDFVSQLRFLRQEFGFCEREHFHAWLSSPTSVPSPSGVVLTFDDGFGDHHDVVAPILSDFDTWGIFYVPTGVYGPMKVLDVHRIHLILGHLGGKRCLELLLELLEDESVASMFPDKARTEFREETYVRQHSSDEATKLFKRMTNYFVDYAWRVRLVDRIVDAVGPSEIWNTWIKGLYMTPDMLLSLQDAGNVVGSHSVTHRVMAKLSVEEQNDEILDSIEMLHRLIGKRPETFCYPYGGFHSFTDDTERLLSEAGVLYSFNVEQRDVEASDVCSRPQALPRYDCNQFPYGRASHGIVRPPDRR